MMDQGCTVDAIDQARRPKPSAGLKDWKWWFLVALHTFYVLIGGTAATLLVRFYYNQGGKSKWIVALVMTAGFPLLFIQILDFPSKQPLTTVVTPCTPYLKVAMIYAALGLMLAADNLMHSYGLLYLPVVTYSLICATELAFSAIFSYYLNSQKFNRYRLNSVVLLTFFAALLGSNEDSDSLTNVSKGKYGLGFILTLGASATHSLILSLMHLTFWKVIQRKTSSALLEMLMYRDLVATCALVVGLFISGEWKSLTSQMKGYARGKISYVMTLVGIALSWQLALVGFVRLVFVVSSLFLKVMSIMELPMVPLFAVLFFHDKINSIKIIAMLIVLWSMATFDYQNYLDETKA